jgi:hypothetical protein
MKRSILVTFVLLSILMQISYSATLTSQHFQGGDAKFTNMSASQIKGPVTGDLMGNVTGNVTGNVNGNVTGIVNGNRINASLFANLSTAVSSATTVGKTIEVSSAVTCNTLTIPSNRGLSVVYGGNINQTGTLTINGPFSAPRSQVFTGTGTVTFGMVLDKLRRVWFPASYDFTDTIQNLIDTAYDTDGEEHPTIYLGSGQYSVTQLKSYNHVRIIGEGQGTAHSAVADQYQTEIIQPAGTNLDLILFDTGDTSSFVHDVSIEGISLRGGWTGPGDATTTAGSAIKFSGVTPGQNVQIRDLNIHDFAEDGIELTRHAIPANFRNIWGRKLGGNVIHVKTVAGRGSHDFSAHNIGGDYIVGAIINLDEAAIVAGSGNSLQASYLFQDIKHEIDSDGVATDTYGQDTIVINDCDRGSVVVINANALVSGTPTPDSNSVVKITGSKRPNLTVINSRMGSGDGVSDFLIDDDVASETVGKRFRNAIWSANTYNLLTSNNNADIIEETRQRAEGTGTMDAYARFKRSIAGLFSWGSGAADVDTSLSRAAANTLAMSTGDSFRIPAGAVSVGGQVTSTLQLIDANGTVYYIWASTAGALRVSTSKPANELTGGAPL